MMSIKKSKRDKPIQMICSQLIKLVQIRCPYKFASTVFIKPLEHIVLNLPSPMGRFSDLIGFHIQITANGIKAPISFTFNPLVIVLINSDNLQ